MKPLMMNMRILTLLLPLLCASCKTTMMGPATVLTSEPEALRGATISQERVTGSATEHALLFSHIVLGNAAPQRAVEDAVSRAGEHCIGLSEMFISARFAWWIPFLYTHYVYTVEGSPIYRATPKPAQTADK